MRCICCSYALLLTPVPPPRLPPPRLCASDDPTASFFRRQLLRMPDEPEVCLLQMRSAIREAIEAGTSRLWIDIGVPELDSSSRGFDPEIFASFALGAAQELDAPDKAPVLLAHGLTTALATTKVVRDATFADGIGAALVMPLEPGGGFDEAASDDDDDDDDNPAAQRLAQSVCPLIILGPANGQDEHAFAQQWRTQKQEEDRIVLLLNHRPSGNEQPPRFAGGVRNLARRVVGRPPAAPPILPPLPPSYEVVFELMPVVLQQSALTGRRGGGGSSGDGGGQPPPEQQQQQQQHEEDPFLSARGRSRFVPKAVLVRRYPAAWTLLADGDDTGYEEVRSFNNRPGSAAVLDSVGRAVRASQAELQKLSAGAGTASGGTASGGMAGEMAVGEGGSVSSAGISSSPRPSPGSAGTAAVQPTPLPEGVEWRTWAQLDGAGAVEAFQWYTAGCILRLREAGAREEGASGDATSGGGGGGGEPWNANDQREGTLHLYAADDAGWRDRPIRLAACALLLLDAAAPGEARLAQLSMGSGASGRWLGSMLEAAEALARFHEQRSVAVQAGEGTIWQAACEQRGFVRSDEGGGVEGGGSWLVKRLPAG